MADTKLKWGIIATGMIARRLADGVAQSEDNQLVAVGSRKQETADAFGDEFNVPQRFGSYQALLDSPDVQAVYIATPHPMHAEWAIKAAEAGKHILVEKPIGINAAEAAAMIDAAEKHGVFLMEAFMYRCHPQIRKLVELVKSGCIGEVRMIEAEFSYSSDAPDDHRAFAQALGGGGILDVGCYPASFARLIAGAAIGKPFDNPVEVKACGHLGPTGVDLWSTASVKFAGGIIGQLTTAVKMPGGSSARIVGSKGWIEVLQPWVPGSSTPAKLVIRHTHGGGVEEIEVPSDKDLYTFEAEAVSRAVAAGEVQSDAMPWADTIGNLETLDRWRREIGLVYEMEKPAN